MHAEDIKAAVRKRGVSLAKLAERNGLNESACRVALIRPKPDGEKAIAEFTGLALHKLWPDRYDAMGKRIVRRGPKPQSNTNVPKPSSARGDAQRLKRGAK